MRETVTCKQRQNILTNAPNIVDRQAAITLTEQVKVLKEKADLLAQQAEALRQTIGEAEALGKLADRVGQGLNFYEEVRRFEVNLILRVLEQTDGHQTRAAELLSLKLSTLNEKIKRYGIATLICPRPEAASEAQPLTPSRTPHLRVKKVAAASYLAPTQFGPTRPA